MVLLLICDLVLVIVCLELQILSEQAMIAEFDRCDKEYAAGISVPAGLDNTLNNPLGVPVCKPDLQRANSLHEAEIILAWCSVTILAIFLAENLLLIVCQGLEYFTDFFYVMELFVVSFSLALELVFLLAATPAANIGSLFIIARTWRFARVAHGFYFLEHSSEHSAQGGDTEKHAGKEPS